MRIGARRLFWMLGLGLGLFAASAEIAWSHHVLGRPSYSLNEDSNTPPTMQLEVQIGDYLATIMAFPAFPKVGQESRLKFYAQHLDTGEPFTGPVLFQVADDGWFGGHSEELGSPEPIDGIHTQAVFFSKEGDYLVTASFEAGGAPYIIDMPLTIGAPLPILPISAGTVLVVGLLLSVSWRKRVARQARAAKIARVQASRSNP